MNLKKTVLALVAGLVLGSAAEAASITGAGASFVFPAMTKWSSEYNKATGHKINYQSIGSGGGIAQAKANTVAFGSSDAPLKSEDLAAHKLRQFPSVIGGVVPVVNLPGIKPGEFKLTGDVLANMYLGKVNTWDHADIKALNPTLALPSKPIRLIYRSDGSGTTFNFVNYLGKMSPEWKTKVGEGTAVRWPGGFGGKGNEGVAAYVKQIQGSIGYVELSYALTNKLTYTAMKNAAGEFVQPNFESFQAAAATADWANATDFNLVITNAPGQGAWPIAATNFILMSEAPKSVDDAKAAIAFFKWVYTDGDASAKALGYVPLPDSLVASVEQYWATYLKY